MTLREDLEAKVGKMTPGPFRWTQTEPLTLDQKVNDARKFYEHGTQERLSGVMALKHPQTVIGPDPDRPEHAVLICSTGDGPNSDNNAQALDALCNAAPALLAALRVVEAVRAENAEEVPSAKLTAYYRTQAALDEYDRLADGVV